jgi:hypothetical protein
MSFLASSYGPAVARFLERSLGPSNLASVDSAELFPRAPFPREAMAGLWLYFDDLDRSHTVSQELSSQEGAFWHGIMHRREPDPSNAAYWYRRVGRHAVFPALREAANGVGYPAGTAATWDPFAWIDYWERTRRQPGSPEHRVALEVQRVEWEILFDHCARP